MQGRHPQQALRQPPPDQSPAPLVDDLDIVMGLSPIVSNEQQPASSLDDQQTRTTEKTCYDLMDQCSPARHPTSTTGPLTDCRGTI
jgi:hypothetical protein